MKIAIRKYFASGLIFIELVGINTNQIFYKIYKEVLMYKE